ncbi:MAG: hypothetical protein L6R40_008639, partial [Gallowayella cf. fulva]
ELRLRRNWTVQEIVEAFQLARSSLSSLAVHHSGQSEAQKSTAKRKVDDTDLEEDAFEPTVAVQGRRKTRSQDTRRPRSSRPDSAGENLQPEPIVTLPSRTSRVFDNEPSAEGVEGSGSAACPICGQRMKEEAVFMHLDTHNERIRTPSPQPTKPGRSPSIEIIGRSRTKLKPPERLPQINYSLMKDAALRKKLSDLGIPNTGPRALLIRRHAEWINIVNANADSTRPGSKREMLRELELWDRSTGRSIANNGNELNNVGSVMRKDFDAAAWSSNHSSDFQDLISKARNTGRANNAPKNHPNLTHTSPEQETLSSPSRESRMEYLPEGHIDSTARDSGNI